MGKKRSSDDCAKIQNKKAKASSSHASECDDNDSASAKNSSDVNNKKQKTDAINESVCSKKKKVVDFVSSDESSQSDSDSEAIVSKVKKTSYKSKIKPPKDAFKIIPKVNKPQDAQLQRRKDLATLRNLLRHPRERGLHTTTWKWMQIKH